MLAGETARRGIPLIHLSTDYVFDGRKGAPYIETDAPAPLNVYGQSKLAGERAVAAAQSAACRSCAPSWVYSPHGQNFVKTILRLAGERDRLAIVDDQRGCPTAARDVARHAVILPLHKCVATREDAPYGIYHYCGAGETTWFGFAKAIVEMASTHRPGGREVVPITDSRLSDAGKPPGRHAA